MINLEFSSLIIACTVSKSNRRWYSGFLKNASAMKASFVMSSTAFTSASEFDAMCVLMVVLDIFKDTAAVLIKNRNKIVQMLANRSEFQEFCKLVEPSILNTAKSYVFVRAPNKKFLARAFINSLNKASNQNPPFDIEVLIAVIFAIQYNGSIRG